MKLMDPLEFSLSAALCGNAVFTTPTDVMDKLQLILGQTIVFQKLLESAPGQRGDLLHWKRELYLCRKRLQPLGSFPRALKCIRNQV